MWLALQLLPIMAVIIHLSTQSSVCVTCKIEYKSYPGTNHTQTTCLAENLIVESENENLNIVSIHSVGVAAFMADKQAVHYLPTGITKAFPSLAYLTVRKSKLQKITRKNLEEFNHLVYLDLSWNKIEQLEHNLFEHNPHLQNIFLNNNHIVQIDSIAFSAVQSLRYLDLQCNECFSIIVYNHSEAMKITANDSCQAESKIAELINTRNRLTNASYELNELQKLSKENSHGLNNAVIITLFLTILVVQLISIYCSSIKKSKTQENTQNYDEINVAGQNRARILEPRDNVEVYDELQMQAREEPIYNEATNQGTEEDFYVEIKRDSEYKEAIYGVGSQGLYAEVHKK